MIWHVSKYLFALFLILGGIALGFIFINVSVVAMSSAGPSALPTLPLWLATALLCFPVLLGIFFGGLIIRCGVGYFKGVRKEIAEEALREVRMHQRITSGVFAAAMSGIIFFCAIQEYFVSPTIGLITFSYVVGSLYLFAAGAWLLLAVQLWRSKPKGAGVN